MMKLVLVLASLLGLSLAATLKGKPVQCKSPPWMTGAITFFTQNEKAFAYIPYEYDAFGHRIRMYEVGTYQNQSFTNDLLLLFNEHVMYQIDDKAQKCTKQPLEGEFLPFGVPPDASVLGSAELGSSSIHGGGLPVNSWVGQTPDGVPYMVTVTDVGCVPISTAYKTDEFGWVSLGFINNVDGLVDPNALNPPPFCSGSEVKPEAKPVNFFTVIKSIIKNAH